MNRPSLTGALRAGGALGSWCGFASFAAVESMTLLGFDFLVLDMQHCEITQAHLPALFGAFGGRTQPVVRAPRNDYHMINWLFDNGAAGVLVPMTNSAADARRAVDAAKFPPRGRRSFGPFRAARYGGGIEEYMRDPDAASTLIVQIEDAEALRQIDDILAVDGIDAVFMGPNDIAFSMLRPGERIKSNAGQWSAFARSPEVLDLCAQALERARARGIPFGTTAASFDDARQWLARGASFATFGSDFLFLREGVRHLCPGLPDC